jgi:metal-responsive CopG/Arc/MetJ family transcriptional regulator
MRTLIDIPENDLKLLNKVVRKLEISRTEFIRRAIHSSLAPHRGKMSHESFGAWATFAEDGLAYQERIRSEW